MLIQGIRNFSFIISTHKFRRHLVFRLIINFTLENFKKVFYENNFVELLLTTFYFTFFGTVGAIIFGILAAQLVNQNIQGRSYMRGILLFPYVGPVVALAYTWTLLLDPNSGTLNALLVNFNIIEKLKKTTIFV